MADPVTVRARRLYDSALVWDAHSGFMPEPAADLDHLNVWRDAGVGHLSINVGFDLLPWEHIVRTIAAFRAWIANHAERFVLAQTAQDIHRARAEGRLALTFDIEGVNALDGRIEMVELYHRLGVRQMLLAYNLNNLAGGGCHDEDIGLSEFGRAVIKEMNHLGLFVDLSHCGYRTSMAAMECSTHPVIFSHSNPRALCNHERNIDDEQIKACAATGGVIGIVGLSMLLGRGLALADHACYLLDLVGPTHVGIGLDYACAVQAPRTDEIIRANRRFWPADRGYGLTAIHHAAPAELLELTEVLLRRGHSDEVVRGVLGGNFLRLAERVWK